MTSDNLRPPGLVTILVGADKASQVYVNMKHKACEKVGIKTLIKKFDEDISINILYNYIKEQNENPEIDGILGGG